MEKLSVFVSWSGKRSKVVAEGVADWLPNVLSNVDALWSDRVAAGEELFGEINEMLKQSNFVILCLTPENVTKTWISYEAGVVFGKSEKMAKICPYLLKTSPDFTRTKLPTPIAHFHGVMADKSGTRKLVGDINRATPNPLSKTALDKIFKKRWHALKKVLDKAAAMPPPQPRRDPADDFLQVSRDIACHRDGLERKFLSLIDQTISDYLSGTYLFKKTVDAAYEEIKNSEAGYENRESVLVGNVREFFIEHFNKGNLRTVIKLMDADMKAASGPIEMREKLTTRMKDVLDSVFSRYQVILANKLAAYLNKNRQHSS